MARIRLKTKLVLAISSMVFALVAVFSYLYVSHLVRQHTAQAHDSAMFVAREMRESAGDATKGLIADSDAARASTEAIERVVETRLRNDPGLNTLLNSIVGYADAVYDASITDLHGRAIVHTTPGMVDKQVAHREDFDKLINAKFLQQLRMVYGAPLVYDVRLPIQRQNRPFGDIRVGISTTFLKDAIRKQLKPALTFSGIAILVSLLLAAAVSNIALRPLEAIGRRLDQMTAGVPDSAPEPDPELVDEFGLVNTKIDRLGRQIRDVKEVFSALKENLDQIMGTLQDGLVLFTREGRVVLVSASAEKFVGLPREAILGGVVDDIFTDANKLGRIVLDAFALHQNLPPREIELENGRRVQISLDFIHERGQRIGSLLTMRDAESVRRIENEIELSRRLAAIGRLTSGVAHEVKNPINAIVVHLELLREKMKDIEPDNRRHMDIIENEIRRLDRVVQTLVDFNRPVELRLSDFDLRRMAEEVALLASPESARLGVRIETHLGTQPLPVRADADLIKQAILNVVLNGVQAMSGGGVLTIATGRDEVAAGIQVSDQGAGIPPEIRDKIFNLYFTTKKAGSGIGLAMAYRVLQLHNGSIDFESDVGKGTTFRLLLPLSTTGAPEAAEAITRSS